MGLWIGHPHWEDVTLHSLDEEWDLINEPSYYPVAGYPVKCSSCLEWNWCHFDRREEWGPWSGSPHAQSTPPHLPAHLCSESAVSSTCVTEEQPDQVPKASHELTPKDQTTAAVLIKGRSFL